MRFREMSLGIFMSGHFRLQQLKCIDGYTGKSSEIKKYGMFNILTVYSKDPQSP